MELDELVRRVHGPADSPYEGPGTTVIYYEELARHIREAGDEGFAFLMDELGRAQGNRLAAVLFGLSWRKVEPKPPPRVFLPYLAHPDFMVAQQAIDSLRTIGARDERERVLELRAHPSPYVRSAGLRFLVGLFPDEARPLLRQALSDPSAVIRHNAVDDLTTSGTPSRCRSSGRFSATST